MVYLILIANQGFSTAKVLVLKICSLESLCWGFTAQSTMKSCRAGQFIVVLFLDRLRPSKRLTSTKRGYPRQ